MCEQFECNLFGDETLYITGGYGGRNKYSGILFGMGTIALPPCCHLFIDFL